MSASRLRTGGRASLLANGSGGPVLRASSNSGMANPWSPIGHIATCDGGQPNQREKKRRRHDPMAELQGKCTGLHLRLKRTAVSMPAQGDGKPPAYAHFRPRRLAPGYPTGFRSGWEATRRRPIGPALHTRRPCGPPAPRGRCPQLGAFAPVPLGAGVLCHPAGPTAYAPYCPHQRHRCNCRDGPLMANAGQQYVAARALGAPIPQGRAGR